MSGIEVLIVRERLAGHAAFQIAIDARGGQEIEGNRVADAVRVRQNEITHLRRRRGRQHVAKFASIHVGLDVGLRHFDQKRRFDHFAILRRFHHRRFCSLNSRGVECHRNGHKRLAECAATVERNRGHEKDQERAADGNRRDAIPLEPCLDSIAFARAGILNEQR